MATTSEEKTVKHTAGPWRLETRLHVHAICCNETRSGEFPEVCQIPAVGHPEYGSITGRKRTNEELLGNARLIAAAPELLSTLQALTDWAREHTSPRQSNTPHEILIEAMAVIAKATGQE